MKSYNRLFRAICVISTLFIFFACSADREPEVQKGRFAFNKGNANVPEFDAQSAYRYIETQVSFGTREPNSIGHRQTREFLIETLRGYAGTNAVFSQDFQFVGYDGEVLNLSNIIAAFNLNARDRILLAAHWDTRPRADEESDPNRQNEPIIGANDGGSGVGVLLELARIFSENMPPIGVDILFFDGEDYGKPSDLDNYFLGARAWSANPPVPGYSPRFGILLDMVGAQGATFPKEGFSRRYAPALVNNVWDVARELGYDHIFIDRNGAPVADDHWIVNIIANIPMIDIIHYDSPDGQSVQFPEFWHTHNDNMDIISTETLQAVGDVLVEIIYNRLN